jgi:hypothetical protein
VKTAVSDTGDVAAANEAVHLAEAAVALVAVTDWLVQPENGVPAS